MLPLLCIASVQCARSDHNVDVPLRETEYRHMIEHLPQFMLLDGDARDAAINRKTRAKVISKASDKKYSVLY